MGSLNISKSLEEGYQTLENTPELFVPAIIVGIADISEVLITQVSSLAGSLLGFVFSLLNLFLGAWSIKLAYESYQDNEISLKKEANYAFDKYLSFLGASILYAVIGFAGVFALILPGLYLFVRLSLFDQDVIIGDNRAVESIKNSWEIVKGNWWEIFFLMVLFTAIFTPLMILSFLDVNYLIIGIASAVVNVFVFPWKIGTYNSAYLQIKE